MAGREADDNGTFRKRYREFAKLNPSIVEHYLTRGILVAVSSISNMLLSCILMAEQIDTSAEADVSYQKLVDSLRETDRWRSLVSRT